LVDEREKKGNPKPPMLPTHRNQTMTPQPEKRLWGEKGRGPENEVAVNRPETLGKEKPRHETRQEKKFQGKEALPDPST